MKHFEIKTPKEKPLFSERYGYNKPIFRFLGYRVFKKANVIELCDSAKAIDKLKHIADDHECCRVDLMECIKIFETLIEVNEIYRQEGLRRLGK